MKLWPLKYEIKILPLSGKNSINPINSDDEQLLSEAKIMRHERNKIILKDYVKEVILLEIAKFKEKNCQPFNEGDFVVNRYFGYSPAKNNNGWLGNSREFVASFKSDKVKGPVAFKVKKCFLDDGWLKEKLELQNRNSYYENLEELKTEREVKALVDNRLTKIRVGKSNVVQWAVDMDWEFHKFPSTTNEWLDLKWGGFPVEDFVLLGSEEALEQIELFKLKEDIILKQNQVETYIKNSKFIKKL